MADLFSIGRSALLSFKTGLQVTGQNIANVDTPGYTRQRVEIQSRYASAGSVRSVGDGIGVRDIKRIFDGFVTDQIRLSTSNVNRESKFLDLAGGVESLVSNESTSLSTALSTFFESAQDVSTDPTSIASRQVQLSDSKQLVDRFNFLNSQLVRQRDNANAEIEAIVDEVNTLAQGIADYNARIADLDLEATNANELFDQRDELVRELSELVNVETVRQDDGTDNVFIGKGTSLVVGDNAFEVATTAPQNDPQAIELGIRTPGTVVPITNSISGGRLAGAVEFRNEMLAKTQAELGRVAINFASTYNAQHRQGIDLNGDVGGDVFAVGSPEVVEDTGNSQFGSDAIQVNIIDSQALEAADYDLSYDGANFTLTNRFTGNNVALTQTGPNTYEAAGLEIQTDPNAQAGDSYILRPTRNGARDINLLLSDPKKIAAASTHSISAAAGNSGNATASVSVDYANSAGAADPNFFDDFQVEFATNPPAPADTYRILDSNGTEIQAPQPYTAGQTISFNGLDIEIDGNVGNGDTFAIQSNQNAPGNNENALELAQIQQREIFNGGSATIEETYESLVGDVATRTRQARISGEAQTGLLNSAVQQRESISGVNLDEEAANLQRYQQYYQASAQVISTADEVFNTLLGAVN